MNMGASAKVTGGGEAGFGPGLGYGCEGLFAEGRYVGQVTFRSCGALDVCVPRLLPPGALLRAKTLLTITIKAINIV